jgi:hypothetical protein
MARLGGAWRGKGTKVQNTEEAMSDKSKTSVVDEIRDRDAREAAWITLRDKLDEKKRGDRITAAEVVEWSGFTEWRRFDERIKTWARRRGMTARMTDGDGWALLTAAEELLFAEGKRKEAFRKEKKGLRALLSVPVQDLDERMQRRHEFQLAKAQQRTQVAADHDVETRKEFKLGPARERVPLRLIAQGKK